MVIAETTKNGTIIHTPVVDAVKREIITNNIDAMIVDPFITSHRVTENDNNAIDLVVKQGWIPIADQNNCAVDLVHHSRKTGGNETTTEDSRGASALVYAARSAPTLNVMTNFRPRTLVSMNIAAVTFELTMASKTMPHDRTVCMVGENRVWATEPNRPLQHLGGDDVGVVTEWHWPHLSVEISADQLLTICDAIIDGKWRRDQRANDWIGKPIAHVLQLDIGNQSHKVKIKALVKNWIGQGALILTMGFDIHRNERSFVELGDWSKAQPT